MVFGVNLCLRGMYLEWVSLWSVYVHAKCVFKESVVCILSLPGDVWRVCLLGSCAMECVWSF